jgi:uncharacterized protein (TIRG00374 family)
LLKKWLIVLWVVLLMTAAVGVAFVLGGKFESFKNIPELLAAISPMAWAAIIGSAALCFLFDYLRLRTLLGVLNQPLPVSTGLQAMVVSEFASIVTPTAELHIPATVYVLSRRGIPAAIGTAAVTGKTLYIIFWVALLSLAVLPAAEAVGLPLLVVDNIFKCKLVVGLIVVFFAAVVFGANPLSRWTHKRLQKTAARGWSRAFWAWLGSSTEALATIGKSKNHMHLLAHLSAICYIAAYCLCGYCIARALGVELGYAQALIIFTLSLFVTYLGLVPGSIGVTEAATAYLLGGDSPRSLAIAILLRLLTRYIALPPGAFVFFRIVRRHNREKNKQ